MQSLKPVKLLATCKRTQQHSKHLWPNNVGSYCVRLLVTLVHVFIFVVVVFDERSFFFLSLSVFFLFIKLRIIRRRLLKSRNC